MVPEILSKTASAYCDKSILNLPKIGMCFNYSTVTFFSAVLIQIGSDDEPIIKVKYLKLLMLNDISFSCNPLQVSFCEKISNVD